MNTTADFIECFLLAEEQQDREEEDRPEEEAEGPDDTAVVDEEMKSCIQDRDRHNYCVDEEAMTSANTSENDPLLSSVSSSLLQPFSTWDAHHHPTFDDIHQHKKKDNPPYLQHDDHHHHYSYQDHLTNVLHPNTVIMTDGDEDELSSPPSLTLSSDSESSSFEDYYGNDDCDTTLATGIPHGKHRRGVHFCPFVTVYEHTLTIGDHPFCDDPLALSLDWGRAEPYRVLLSIHSQGHRTSYYRPPRRLSLDERRDRLVEVAGNRYEEIDAFLEEYNIVVDDDDDLNSAAPSLGQDLRALLGILNHSLSNLSSLLKVQRFNGSDKVIGMDHSTDEDEEVIVMHRSCGPPPTTTTGSLSFE